MKQKTINQHQYPNQRVSDFTKRTSKFYKPTCDFKIQEALKYSNSDVREELINAANGEIQDDTIEFIKQPFKKSKDKILKDFKFPVDFVDTGLIKDIVLKLLSEYSLLNHNYQVRINNPDIILRKNKDIRDKVNAYIEQSMINKLNEMGMDTNVESQQLPNLDKFVAELKDDWFDKQELVANNTLDAIRDWTRDNILYQEAYFSYIVTGEYYVDRRVIGTELIKENIPVDEAYPIPNNELYVDEYDGFLRRRVLNINEILTYYEHELEPSDITYIREIIETHATGTNDYFASIINLKQYNSNKGGLYDSVLDEYKGVSDGNITFSTNGEIIVNELCWISEKKVGILTFKNALGEVRERLVNEDYKVDTLIGDIDIEWVWITVPYKMLRIGDSVSGIYTKPRPLEIVQGVMGGLFKNKLNVSGKRGLFRYKFEHSIVGRLLPFEVTARIISAAIKHLISKGLLTGDVQLIPESILYGGKLDANERLLYMISDGRLLYNDANNLSREAALTGFRFVASGRTEILKALIDLYNNNKISAWDSIGWNRQRDGQSFASDGKGVTQEMLYQSMKNVAFINGMFNESRANDYNSDMAWSKLAFINASSDMALGTYRNRNNEIDILALNGEEFASNDYITHAENSAKTETQLQQAKEIAFAAAQNGEYKAGMQTVLANSTAEVKDIIKQLDDLIQADKQAERDNALQQTQMEIEAKQKESEDKYKSEYDITKLKEDSENYRAILKILSAENIEDRKAELERELASYKESMNKTK